MVRRSYHPKPPAHRSEWVMWVGNVASDATHDELLWFFNRASDGHVVSGGGDHRSRAENASSSSTAVKSIFLISHSSCAFVNYESEQSLQEAIERFNGVPLRANDPRRARLVCRVRKKNDDLKAGVGGQRGTGMHSRYVKEQKGKGRESPTKIASRLAAAISTVSISNDEGEPGPGDNLKRPSSSESSASTSSSVLTRHFPRRYFILKSLTKSDLDLSVRTGLWATQKHNEEVLDRAFRTSKEVYLIFGVNKSGEFYGYAKMAGPVRQGEQGVSWAPHSSRSRLSTRPVAPTSTPAEPSFSPLPVDRASPTLRMAVSREHTFAPALLGEGYKLPAIETPKTRHSLDDRLQVDMATRRDESSPESELDASAAPKTLRSVEEPEATEDSWGNSFAVEWIRQERLPFPRTMHLRNPWNHEREVRVSRDGTELEPTVGQRLTEEWDALQNEAFE
ncbi:unnamed protein product [Cyclocybe aegerita]|uniref:YTH domain-containing protein n=1 Tax=Cyclocybe aegerita TaxID=1973307 RepID=A0A8S0WHZ1_CYCAE|nr:unnamed protein product [Cyclocybe aegerita]